MVRYVEELPKCRYCGKGAKYDTIHNGQWGYVCKKCYGPTKPKIGTEFVKRKIELVDETVKGKLIFDSYMDPYGVCVCKHKQLLDDLTGFICNRCGRTVEL